jgi:hypothetical protein
MQALPRVSGCVAAMALLCALPTNAWAASRTTARRSGTRVEATPTAAPVPEAAAVAETATETTSSSALANETAGSASDVSSEPPAAAPATREGGSAERSKYLGTVGIGPGMSLDEGPTTLDAAVRVVIGIPASLGQASLSFVVPLRLSMFGQTTDVGGMQIKTSAFGIAVVPALQLSGTLLPQLRGYGSFGFGPAHWRTRTEVPYFGSSSDNFTMMEFDLTAGVDYALDDRFSLFFEPMGLRIFAGDGLPSMWTMLVGVGMGL